MPANDVVAFVNGLIRTMDPGKPLAQAVAVREGRFAAVGSNETVLGCGDRPRVIDLGGRLALPGFIDGHTHLYWVAKNLDQIDLSNCSSIEEMRKRLRDRSRTTPPGGWIQGWGWHQERLRERRDPVLADIDDVTPDNPVYLVRSCTHSAMVNSVALRMAGIGPETRDPDGGQIVRDAAGAPTGLLHENAMHLMANLIPQPSETEKARLLLAAMNEYVRLGITTAHSVDSGCEGAFRRLSEERAMPIRVYMDEPLTSEAEIAASGPTGDGDDWFRTGAIKFWEDGAFGPRTAALEEPYEDDAGNRGLLVHEPERLKALAVAAARTGRQVMIHALGDRAMRVALDAIEEAVRLGSKRPRLVHCGTIDSGIVERMRRLGVVADLQPCFLPYEVDWLPGRLGPERSRRTYAFRTLMEAGIPCTAGSDAPVDPVDPMIGIYGAVSRSDLNGRPSSGWTPEQRLTVEGVVRMYTQGGAYAEFAEDRKGMIREGYLADMVVLSRDIFEIPHLDIPSTRAVMTVTGGIIRWADPGMSI